MERELDDSTNDHSCRGVTVLTVVTVSNRCTSRLGDDRVSVWLPYGCLGLR